MLTKPVSDHPLPNPDIIIVYEKSRNRGRHAISNLSREKNLKLHVFLAMGLTIT